MQGSFEQQQIVRQFQQMRTELNELAQKINELEAEKNEHRYDQNTTLDVPMGCVCECDAAIAKDLNQNTGGGDRLVIDAVSGLDGSRRCYRLVGGVLVERTVGEVLPAVKKNLEGVLCLLRQCFSVCQIQHVDLMALCDTMLLCTFVVLSVSVCVCLCV